MKIYEQYWQVTSFEDFWFDNAAHLNKKNLDLMLDKLEILGATNVCILRTIKFLRWQWVVEYECNLGEV